MMISLICAVSRNGVIGLGGRLPWKLPNDLKRFKALTMGHPVIMGRKTFESLRKPLPGRTNIVVTHQSGYRADGCQVVGSIEEALQACQQEPEVFVIGGANVYAQALPLAHRIYLTEVHAHVQGDTRMPAFDRAAWRETVREDHPADPSHPYPYSFLTLEKQ